MATTKILSLYHVFLLSLVAAACSFSPADHFLINCGSSAAETLDADHRIFTGDDPRFLASTQTLQLESSDQPSPLYRTARAFTHPAHYVFPIRDRGVHHLIRLHFHPIRDNLCDLNKAEFHVVANGFLLLRNFRPSNAFNSAVIKEFAIPVDSGELKITFLPSEKSGFAFVSAIEVITAPIDLIADVAQLVDSEKNERIYGLLRNGFETVHRVNVGGFKVTPFNDSLWRTWITDDEFFKSSEGSETVHFGGRIKYRMGGLTREVGPDNVYNTARVIRSKDSSIPNVNLTWSFEIEKGYSHMVRMHFCDIASVSTHMLYFNVYVNGNLAYENLDLSVITNALLASPFYADFVVDGGSSGSLAVSVGPSNMSWPRAVDAILNGIEIWKLNNTMGSFDGEVCVDSVWRSWRKGHTSFVLPSIAVIFLLLSASVFLQRRRNASASMGWARLPIDVSESNLKAGNQLSSIK
ncbi:probable receptor-like protein kinase At5g24010 [Salvia miltiorrhiza]|uniref:probable receptor-like protein kinase At5g24010 n=1 Tax=Salvia miltiorrhiza TaxID=226208 RepID=UPI0025AC50C1|nr:probable receptor-like protein kinase At5g24010 [Salvia miltiorrhiza]